MKLNKETVYRVDDDTLIRGYNAVTIWANAYANNFPKARVVEVPKVWRMNGKQYEVRRVELRAGSGSALGDNFIVKAPRGCDVNCPWALKIEYYD